MRLIPIITALLVAMVLYLVVFERDAFIAFAKGGDASGEVTETVADGTDQRETADATSDVAPGGIGVVALRSVAREIDSAVVLRGQTKAIRQVEVRAETTSTVISEPLRKGAFVEAGDLLCELDPGTRHAARAETLAMQAESKARVPEAEARLDEAKAKLREAQVNHSNAIRLSEGGYASETQTITTEAAMRSAEAGIRSAETGLETTSAGIEAATAAVAAAEREIERLRITAPFRGLLESDAAELGSLMQPGSLCATIIQLNPIKLVGFVPETEVNRVQFGASARAVLTTGLEVEGQVTFLSRSADETTRTFEVEITVQNPELLIRDGQTATISIASAGSKAHLVPQSSLTLNNDGELGVRVVGADNMVQFMPVALLRDTAEGVWIGGLPEQADVIVIGQEFVTQGVQVAPTYREAAQ